MDPPAAVNALSPPHSPLNTSISVSVSPKSKTPPRHTPPAQNDDSKNGEDAQDHSADGISALAFKLLVGVQQVFGRQSKEWEEINRALLDFQQGHMSKKEAYHIMKQALGDNYELSQGLFDLLNHNDADWGPDDWSQPISPPAFPQTVNPTSPDFLQPSHEPQFVRLPSMFQALGGGAYVSRPQLSIDPAIRQPPSTHHFADSFALTPYHDGQELPGHVPTIFEEHSGCASHHNQFSPQTHGTQMDWSPKSFVPNALSSPAPLMSNAIPFPQYYASTSWRYDPTLMPSRDFHRDVDLTSGLQSYNTLGHTKGLNSSVVLTPDQAYQRNLHDHQWQDSNPMGGWVDGRHSQYERDHATAERPESHLAFSTQEKTTPQLLSGQLGLNESHSVVGTPTMGVANVPSLSQDTFSKVRHVEGNETGTRNHETDHLSENINMDNMALHAAKSPRPSDVKPHKTQPTSRSGNFIHAICGKGFPTRSAVKKHHWGPKAGDLTTTRGCWAKSQKPDIAWNQHPSCREDVSRPKTKNPKHVATGVDEFVSTILSSNALPAPSIVPGLAKIQHFGDSSACALDTLVSAASFTEKIDAPKPQDCRNDSVVVHLDAQLATAERNHKALPPWNVRTKSESTLSTSVSYNLTQSPAVGLGITHPQVNQINPSIMLPSQSHETVRFIAFAPPGSHTNYRQPSQGEATMTEPENGERKKRQRATGKMPDVSKREQTQMDGSSSGPDQKKAKMQY